MKPNFTHLTFNSNSSCVSTSSVPSTCCFGWQGRCVAPAALGVAFRGRRASSAALGPAGSPKTPRSSADQGARRLYLCTGLRELLRKSNNKKKNSDRKTGLATSQTATWNILLETQQFSVNQQSVIGLCFFKFCRFVLLFMTANTEFVLIHSFGSFWAS